MVLPFDDQFFRPQRPIVGPVGPPGTFGGPGGPTGNVGGRPSSKNGSAGDGGQAPTLEQLLKDLLETNPELPFSNQINQLGRGTAQGRFFGGRFENIRDEFLGQLGGQIQGSESQRGEAPTLRFTDFLENFDFDRRFRSTAPSLRGQGGQARFRPPTQFRF